MNPAGGAKALSSFTFETKVIASMENPELIATGKAAYRTYSQWS